MSPSYDVVPRALDLPADLDRHRASAAELRRAVLELAGPGDPADLAWPDLVEHLLALGRTDVPLARLVEGHVDALRILREAGGVPQPAATYGVWASRSRATGLGARRDGDGWVLDGNLRFASGAGLLDRALVPVWLEDGSHVLLDLDVSSWTPDGSRWRTRAMEQSRSLEYHLAVLRTPAVEVGGADFYLARPGFFPGGVGVAVVWAGAAARVLDLVAAASPHERRSPGQTVRLGEMRIEVATAAALCREVVPRLAAQSPDDVRVTVTLVRAAVAGCVRRVLADARTVAGAAGLALDEDLTRAVDDLTLYVAQLNADADAQFLGDLP